MNLSRGEVVPIKIPFQQAQGARVRPAVVILDSADEDSIGAPIISRSRAGGPECTVHRARTQACGPS